MLIQEGVKIPVLWMLEGQIPSLSGAWRLCPVCGKQICLMANGCICIFDKNKS